MTSRHSLLSTAIEREDWEAAALCLLLGVARVAEALPPDTVEEMIELLAEIPHHPEKRKRGRR